MPIPLASSPRPRRSDPAAASLLACVLLALTCACAPRWHSKLGANSRQVALALGDPAEIPAERFDPKDVPNFAAPKKLRPCCAFGQDLKARVGPVPVPFFEQANVFGPDDLGPHGYDKGTLTREHNGLVYTCRGGFIDIAHVRDNADRTIFLTMQIVRALPGSATIEFPEEGTLRRVLLRPVPAELLTRHGRWTVAAAIASWANLQLSTWHEVVTWYGWQSIKGIDERLSAFSPEDIYSNALGINLAAGIIHNRETGSREQYEQSMTSWLAEALRRLGAVPKAQARLAMTAVDGLWWDSSKRVPDWDLVTRRDLHITSPLAPWLVADAVPDSAALARMCDGQPGALKLVIHDQLGEAALAELATVELEFKDWLPKRFPVPADKGQIVTQADFPAILADVRREGEAQLGPHFDQPGSSAD